MLSKIISFLLGKSYVSQYRTSTEVSSETGYHNYDIVDEYLNGKGFKNFGGWVIGVKEKDKYGYFTYVIEWWPKKDLFKKYSDFYERVFRYIKYHTVG